MARITLGGLQSGMDTDAILEKLLDIESKRVKTEESKKKAVQDRQAAWGEIKTSLTTLRSKLDSIRFAGAFRTRKATVSDVDAAAVTVAAGTTLTTHKLSVSKLAQSHAITSRSDFASADVALGAAAAGAFTISVGGVGKTVTVSATDTLNTLKENIRAQAGSAVTAEVIKVQDPVTFADRYRLVLTSKTSGAAGAITLTPDAGTPNVLEQTGLGFHTTGVIAAGSVVTAAQDAEFKLNNVDYKMSSNSVAGVIPGLTIDLKKQTAGDVTITIDRETDTAASSVQAWVDQLNSTLELIKSKTEFNVSTGKGKVLSSDPLARQLQTTLRKMLSNVVTGQDSTLDSLSDVGITTGAYGSADYGKILLDKTKLAEKLVANEDGVATLFGALRKNAALKSQTPAVQVVATSSELADPDKFQPSNAANDIVAADRWNTTGGGWKSGAAPSLATPQYLSVGFGAAKQVDNINLYLPAGVTTDGLKNFSLEYSNDSTDGLTDGSWSTISSVTDNTGTFRTFDFAPVTAKWVRLKVTSTYGDTAAKVLEMQVHEAANAPALSMYKYVNTSLTSVSGPIDTRDSQLGKQVKEIDTRLERMLDQMEQRENRLRQQFSRMEEALARMQSQGSALLAQMGLSSSRR
ncbi:MAG TPA: flagellar filament capping protein FliD [Symbiobacteriaceae bacterium]|nr:flagellar filament capping protein FliD [Symbiobacteriaceae bacterium]